VSWKDRKKRDRLKEKELIQKARKFKLVDKDDSLDTMAMIFSSKWHQPRLLPPDAENPPVEVNSQEVRVQTRRMASVMPVNYLSEDDVPQNPYPLTEAEQTMDLNAQSAAVPQTIPFFFSQQPPAAAPAPLPLPIHTVPAIPAIPAIPTIPPPLPVHIPAPPMMAPPPSVATIEVVRSMGLPDFLVGQNIQALQALIASPELLNSFRDVNGNYDQMRIMNLIHALNQQLQKSNTNLPPFPPPIAQTPAIPPPMPPTFGHYGSAQVPQYAPIPQASTSYKPPSKLSSNGYRGDQNNTDGNLHLSGYGPNTSTDTLVAMFAPYVKVVEVVPKSGFMFLNTNDPEGAKRAREALNGMMIDGAPLRINLALRRNKNAAGANSSSSMNAGASNAAHLPRNALGQIDFDAVRDDRGNPATKNLFVAGYGPGTTEQQLRDVFNQHTKVTGVVMKGSFSFVNNLEKSSAVIARQALVGTNLNGGSLRINFAKESGRLGTSFDTGYGNGNSNRSQHQLPHQHQPVPNHYGHNKY
jgi:RNA recognition motif-containing protein